MRAGLLSKRVTLVRTPSTTSGTGGQVPGAPESVATVPASIEAVDLRTFQEGLAAGGLSNVVSHVVRIRYRADVSVSWRVTYLDVRRGTTRTFEILRVSDPSERGRELELLCAERVS